MAGTKQRSNEEKLVQNQNLVCANHVTARLKLTRRQKNKVSFSNKRQRSKQDDTLNVPNKKLKFVQQPLNCLK